MREILFRGKRLSNGKLVYGDLLNFIIKNEDRKFILPIGTDVPKHRTIGELQVEVSPNTVGQYTGIKDKNGTRIFEDDVLKITIIEEEDSIEYKLGVVKFSKERLEYIVTTKEEIEYTFGTMLQNAGFYKFEFEVIGNTHDNLERILNKYK